MPIFAPNHNAMRRLSGTVNVATRASWGFEDRDACLRVPESDAKNLRIEHRLAGADANPYLVLAAILVGLEQGLEAGREPIAPLNEDRSSGVDFPLEMLEAVRSMETHAQLREGLGAEFVNVYCENKRQDHLAFLQDISAREYRWYL
jgi:glutamine synthetase